LKRLEPTQIGEVSHAALEAHMDEARARALLGAERARVQALLDETTAAGQENRAAANEAGDLSDPAERLTAEEGDDAVAEQLRQRLAAVARAEGRLDDGTYGKSIRSGQPIPEDRLEADPAAELTAEEAQRR
jgi:DnaK suppressor protein